MIVSTQEQRHFVPSQNSNDAGGIDGLTFGYLADGLKQLGTCHERENLGRGIVRMQQRGLGRLFDQFSEDRLGRWQRFGDNIPLGGVG